MSKMRRDAANDRSRCSPPPATAAPVCTGPKFFDFRGLFFQHHITMDAPDLTPLLEQLEDNVDDLEEVLEPVLGQSLAKLSKNLPVMDRAKIHVLITYTLESLIFCKFRSTFSKQSA
jgi:hypothetical protein